MKRINPRTSKGPETWFTGDVHPTIVLSGDKPSQVRMGSVHFAPGARTAWHSHAVGQYLHIVEGTALVQERGGEVAMIRPGETVYTAPGVPSYFPVLSEVLGYVKPPPLIPEGNRWFIITGTALQSALSGKQSVKEAMDDAAKQVQQLLASAGYYK